MKTRMLSSLFLITVGVYLASCFGENQTSDRQPSPSKVYTSKAIASAKTQKCLTCHTTQNPSIVASWHTSSHAEKGIGCYECHEAQPDDPDVLAHYDDTLISVIVSPKDCGTCHAIEMEQFEQSIHARAGAILGSLNNYLGEVVEGMGASISGCQQCHGSKIIVDQGMLAAETWPNFGIGRINPDGSTGACSACHTRHDFTRAQARTPEACSRCHLGPDHPQKEVYEESKHYITYKGHQHNMNMTSPVWVVGIDYTAAPTCATCHVGATLNQPRTHDIGNRLSWNNRVELSFKTELWERKRTAMKDVCYSCHNPSYVNNFYIQYDVGIELYNQKFARPAQEIMETLRKAGVIDPTPFNQTIEWTYYMLWHHEGRKARNGLAMFGPDYVQWQGFYQIARRFYTEFIPEAERLLPGITEALLERPEHQWFSGEMTLEEQRNISQDSLKQYESQE